MGAVMLNLFQHLLVSLRLTMLPVRTHLGINSLLRDILMSESVAKKASALEIIKTLRGSGFTALIVGGAVRDMVMGIEPKDYDIVTDASPEQVERLFDKVYPVGSQFGVSLVVMNNDAFEVACFRKDGIYEDGRRPSSIKPGDEIADTGRRDFTINALFYDPIEERVIDHVGGIRDIHDRIIRAVGDPRVRMYEDRLRMLRAVRFAARFMFEIDPATEMAVRENAHKVLDVSAERIGEELVKIFGGHNSGYAFTLLDRTGLLSVILPEVSALKGIEQPPEYHPEGDVFEHTRSMLEMYDGGSVTLALGILFHDIAKPVTITRTDRIRFNRHDDIGAEMAGAILRRLRVRNEISERVCALVRNHMNFINVRNMRRSTLRRFIAQEGFHEMLELYRLDCLASHGDLEDYDYLVKIVGEEIHKNSNLKLPAPLLTGDDLITLGYEEGPLIGTILREIEDSHFEGALETREEAINFVRQRFPLQIPRQNRRRRSSQPD
jgi:poly(A) polymerase